MNTPEQSKLRRDKAAWRTRLLRARSACTDHQRLEASDRIRERLLSLEAVGDAGVVFCFISHGNEVDTHKLIDELMARGQRVLVPKILGRERMIAVSLDNWEDLEPGQLGIPTPRASNEWNAGIDVCVTPGLGFTATGKRLGFGRGYYDQWFATHERCMRVAVAFECQVVEDLPVDVRDVPVDAIVTETRLIGIREPFRD